ncbi:hypothetical protein [Shewanella zhangzhouensis]|uniref:hypothetical protein n=1 Tax=Shewanella zhangzhouensis TaxID=2864213 RepID=UPI001C654E64|nr:hypothetical protein [Shewanella zhangzhouensis]QYK04740.1 hypothetical protein K0H63_17065 [Shewanella zhangzhouensis]
MASIRQQLVEGVKKAAREAVDKTGCSVNDLPEYFMAVKVADHVYETMQTYAFTMEDSFQSICDEVGIEELPEECRGNGRADLVLRSVKTRRVRHVVEFKRSIKKAELKKDAIRLAKLCQHAPSQHRIEKNFLVAVTHASDDLAIAREDEIKEWLADSQIDDVAVKAIEIDLSDHSSTRFKRTGEISGRPLVGRLWQFKYNPEG